MPSRKRCSRSSRGPVRAVVRCGIMALGKAWDCSRSEHALRGSACCATLPCLLIPAACGQCDSRLLRSPQPCTPVGARRAAGRDPPLPLRRATHDGVRGSKSLRATRSCPHAQRCRCIVAGVCDGAVAMVDLTSMHPRGDRCGAGRRWRSRCSAGGERAVRSWVERRSASRVPAPPTRVRHPEPGNAAVAERPTTNHQPATANPIVTRPRRLSAESHATDAR